MVRSMLVFRSDEVKFGVVVGVAVVREISKEFERFHFSDSVYDYVGYDPLKTRLSESKAAGEEPANRQVLIGALR